MHLAALQLWLGVSTLNDKAFGNLRFPLLPEMRRTNLGTWESTQQALSAQISSLRYIDTFALSHFYPAAPG